MIDSPCINKCTVDPVLGVCTGCFRSVEEISKWTVMSNDERLSARKAAQQRSMMFKSQQECHHAPKQQECQVPNGKYQMLGY